MKTILTWLAAFASAFVLAACGGGSGDTSPADASVSGVVVDMDTDAPVAGATLTAAGKSVQTQADGRFTLTGLAASPRLLVHASAATYGANVALVQLPAGSTASIRVRLLKLGPPMNFNAEVGATLIIPGTAAQAQVPAGSLVDAQTGEPVSGPVVASLTNVDPARDPERMPGGFTTVQNGTVRAIESFGALKVDLRDAAGRRLNLAPGTSARIRIPLSTRSPNPPASVPLFHFDEATGRWTKEGEAQLRTAANGERYYQGAVSHYSYWNADQVTETVEVEGCVRNTDGSPAAGVIVSGSGGDYSGRTSAITDNEGRFTMQVRRNAITNIWAATETRVTAITEVTVGDTGGGIGGECLRLEPSTSPIPGRLAPRIMQSPRSTTVEAGQPAMLQAVAEGTQPMTYQWQRNGEPIAGSNTNTLWIFNPTLADDGALYTVTATNVAGTMTSTAARLTVSAAPIAPTITTAPLSATALEGDPVTFSVVAQGSGPLAYQWLRNGAPLAGATASILQLVATPGDNAALFSVQVSNAAGSATSAAATLTVVSPQAAPQITQQPASVVVPTGSMARFAVAATGSGPISYQWQRNGANIPAAIEPSYTVNAVTAADHGAQFRVIVSNNEGSVASNAATLTVTSGTADQQAEVLRLLEVWSHGLEAAGAPLQFVDDDFRAVPIGEVCEGGSAVLTLDGAAVPAPGQAFPLGQHTLAAVFSACNGEFGRGYDGRSSVAYDFTDPGHRAGSVQASVTDFVHSDIDDNGDPVSVRVNGNALVQADGSLSGDLDTQRLRFTPSAGMTLTDVASGTASVLGGGSVLLHTVTVATETGPRPQLTRQEHAQLGFSRNGVAYVTDGFLQFDFDAQGHLASGSGEVTLTANGQLVARVRATEAGYVVDVLAPMPGLAPQAQATSVRRVRAGSGATVTPAAAALRPDATSLRRPAPGRR